MAPDRISSRPAWIMLAALLTAPWLSRVLLHLDAGGPWASADLRGFLADLAVTLVALPVGLMASRLSRWVALLLVLGWNLFHWLNLEVVADLGSMGSVLDVGFLGDRDFLIGSATQISWPWALVLLCLLTGLAVWRVKGNVGFGPGMASLTIAVFLLVGLGRWSVSDEVADWRQDDFIRANFAYVLQSSRSDPPPARDPRAAMVDLVPDLVADLDGEPILTLPGQARNVLLVMVEGVSGAYLPSLAADHGLHGLFAMPELDRIATTHLSYSTFVSHNRKTNRGVFSLLCGEPPNLYPGTPKMTQMALMGGRTCLPQVLRDHGFDTAFLQAAPLAFMVKDQFAIRAGFERVHGLADWDVTRSAAHSKWGIDDSSFYEQSLGILEKLHGGDRPWFASVLTVGTHHPFVFPEDHVDQDGDDVDRRQAAFTYADRAVGQLIGDLRDRGILEDTLVLITSDESRGAQSLNPGLSLPNAAVTRRMSTNWGLLVAIPPEDRVERIREPFAQMDVALSVLDYLGLEEASGMFLGRSVFRRYRESRIVPFANTNLLRASALDSAGTLFDCRIDSGECRKWWVAEGAFFGPEVVEESWDASRDSWVLDLAQRSQAEMSSTVGSYEIDLLVEKHQTVVERRLLHGGPYLSIEPGQWLEIEIEVEASGGQGEVVLKHRLTVEGHWGITQSQDEEAMYHREFRLKNGDRLELRYTWSPEGGRGLDGVKVETLAEADPNSPWVLRFQKAVLKVRRDEPKPLEEFELQLERVSRP